MKNICVKKKELFDGTWSDQSRWLGLDNSGWNPQHWWPTKLLTRCGEQCEFNWPRPQAISRGQRVTSDNRERAGWLVNQGHGVGGGGQCGPCTVHWCRGMFDRTSVFLFSVLEGMLPTTKAELGGSSRGERPGAVMDTTATASAGAPPPTIYMEILQINEASEFKYDKEHWLIL